jgi:hypothetical protein
MKGKGCDGYENATPEWWLWWWLKCIQHVWHRLVANLDGIAIINLITEL